MSADPILVATKLHPPRARRPVVGRPDLVARLSAADVRLVLVCAPAGWGKTTLVADWAERVAGDRAPAWLSLDPDDDEPVRFWAHVLGALGRAVPEFDRRPGAIVRAPGARFARDVLPVLVNASRRPAGGSTWCSTICTWCATRRSTTGWPPSSIGRRRACGWCWSPGPTRRSPSRGCGPPATCWSCGPPTSA